MAGLLLTVPLPASGRAIGAGLDLCHAPAFAILAVALHDYLRDYDFSLLSTPGAPALVAWLCVVAFGLISEGAQALTGRYASAQDALANGLGATAGLVWVWSRGAAQRRRAFGKLGAGLILMVASLSPLVVLADAYLQQAEFPHLASFEHPLELTRWEPVNSRLSRSRHATHGTRALQVDLAPGRFAGATLAWPPANWSGWRTLVLDVRLDAGGSLDLTVKIEDALHNGEQYDRFEQTFELRPGWQRLSVRLAEVAEAPRGRRLDLGRITKLELFTSSLSSPRELVVDNVHLQ